MSTISGETKKPGRRRLRISIGVLCLLIAALAVGLARVTNEARRQRRAIETIKKLGGTYRFDYEFVGGDPRASEIFAARPPGSAWLRRWIGDEPFRDVVLVNLSGDKVHDDDLALLEDLPRLRSVFLYRTFNITDAGLAHLRSQRRLVSLNVYRNPKIGDAGIAHIRDLDTLEDLFFDGTRVGDAGIAQIHRLKALRELDLDGTEITDVGLAKLAAFPLLTKLYVNNTPTSEAGFASLARALPKITISGSPRTPNAGALR